MADAIVLLCFLDFGRRFKIRPLSGNVRAALIGQNQQQVQTTAAM